MNMNIKIWITAAGIGLLGLSACGDKGADMGSAAIKTRMDSVSYAIGLNIGRNFAQSGMDSINYMVLAKALQDAKDTNNWAFNEEKAKMIMDQYRVVMEGKQQAEFAKKATENLRKGEAFFAENKTKEGVVALESGLQYKILKAGNGAKPTIDSRVKVHYVGTNIDGKEFDSSIRRGQPAVFGLQEVIPGWMGALQLMPVGSKWMVYVPSNLGYGERGNMPSIAPNEALIFEVELLGIEGKIEEKK